MTNNNDEWKIDSKGQKYREVTIEGFLWDKKYRVYDNAKSTGVSGCGIVQDENDPERKDKLCFERI